MSPILEPRAAALDAARQHAEQGNKETQQDLIAHAEQLNKDTRQELMAHTDRRINETLVLIEDLRHDLQGIAEGVLTINQKLDR